MTHFIDQDVPIQVVSQRYHIQFRNLLYAAVLLVRVTITLTIETLPVPTN